MGTHLITTMLVFVRVVESILTAHACNTSEWDHPGGDRAWMLRKARLRESNLILMGFETPVGEFEVYSERGRGMIDFCELYPSIYGVENSRTLYRFGRESDLLLFKMQWDWL